MKIFFVSNANRRILASSVAATAMCFLASVPLCASPLPTARIEVDMTVNGVRGNDVVLQSGAEEQVRPGAVLDILNAANQPVSQVVVTSVGPVLTHSRVVQGNPPLDAAAIAGLHAVAPRSLPITRLDGNTIYFWLPARYKKLQAGDTLTIVHGTSPIATAHFQGYRPVSASIGALKPGALIAAGDAIWVYAAPEADQWMPAPSGMGSIAPMANTGAPMAPASPVAPTGPTVTVAPANPVVPTSPAAHSSSQGTAPSQGLFQAVAPNSTPRPLVTARHPADAGRSLSRSGPTGLIRMPSADVTPEGEVQVAGFSSRKTENIARMGNSETAAFEMGFLPHMEFGATVGDSYQDKDLTGNIKLQIVHETDSRPAIALGISEYHKLASGTLAASTIPLHGGDEKYLVGSKHLFGGAVDVTLGAVHGNVYTTRPYGGAEVGLVNHVSAVVEQDGEFFNYGLRGAVLKDKLSLAAVHLHEGWRFDAGYEIGLDHHKTAPDSNLLPRYGADYNDLQAVHAISRKLVSLGLENVRVRIARGTAVGAGAAVPGTLEVAYENRSYPHSEMDALANALAAGAIFAPDSVGRISIVVERQDVAVLHFACPLESYRQFMAGHSDETSFVQDITIDRAEAADSGERIAAESKRSASTFGRSDLFIRPELNEQFATDNQFFGTGLNFQPELELPLARGVMFDARADIPGFGTLRDPSTEIDRAAIDITGKLGHDLFGGAYLGRFPGSIEETDNITGGLAEALWEPDRSRFSARISGGELHHSDGETEHQTYIAEGRYYLAEYDARFRLNAGRYIEGDSGETAALQRHFGDTEVELQYRHTNLGHAAVMQLGIPVGPSHLSEMPTTLRIRPPDFFEYAVKDLVTSPNFYLTAHQTGNELPVGPDVTNSLLDRDKLNRAYILRSLSWLREVHGFVVQSVEPAAK